MNALDHFTKVVRVIRFSSLSSIPLWLALACAGFAQQMDGASAKKLETPSAAYAINAFRQECRIPASFRENTNGLEIVSRFSARPISGSNATQLQTNSAPNSLKVGDVITQVGNTPVRTVGDLFQQLRISSSPLSLKIMDGTTQKTATWSANATLVNVPKGLARAKADGTGKIHVIHAVTTLDDSIGAKIATNVEPFEDKIREHISQDLLGSYTKIIGSDCTAQGIVSKIVTLPVKPQDSILFYYQGHGAFDSSYMANDPAGGHFFDFANQDLLRRDLLRVLQSKGVRLSVLISDACNVKGTIEYEPQRQFSVRTVLIEGWTGLEELMLCYRGTLDLTAASRGQYSWCTKDIGGWFTTSFLSGIEQSVTNKPRSWDKFWNQVKISTARQYESRRNLYRSQVPALEAQAALTPQEFVWDIERDDPPQGPPKLTRPFTILNSIELPQPTQRPQ